MTGARGLPEVAVDRAAGAVSIRNQNTTIGYCRFGDCGHVEYVFVHPAFRRRGVAKLMLRAVAEVAQIPLTFEHPLSPLGRKLHAYYVSISPLQGSAE